MHLFPSLLATASPDARAVLDQPAFFDVAAERIEQIDEHGFGPAHDLGHHPGDLALAAASYLNTAIDQLFNRAFAVEPDPATWPWEREAWRPGSARDNLVKATAIAWAVIDRLDADPAPSPTAPGEASA